VDVSLVRDIARLRPDWSFVLVGPQYSGAISGSDAGIDSLAETPNVHLLGPRPYPDVPAYLEAFDVATIPFKISGLTEDTNPIKLYEYLAAGVPVVSTPLPEVLAVPGVRVAQSPEDFVTQIGAALQERDDPQLRAARMAVAAENSWQKRAGYAWETLTFTGGAPAIAEDAESDEARRPRVLVIATDPGLSTRAGGSARLRTCGCSRTSLT
jgi:glycosyltransferase involved in cell wall biosynthesis